MAGGAVQRSLWLGSSAATLLLVAAAIYGLRGTPAPREMIPPAPAAAVKTQPPETGGTAAPAASAAQPATPDRTPSFDIVRVDPDGQAVIAGRAAPGDRVRVLDGDKPVGEVTADARGEWVLLPAAPIGPGDRQLALEASRPDGGAPVRSKDVVGLSVPGPGGKAGALAVLLPEEAAKPAQAFQVPRTGPETAPLGLDTAEYGDSSRLLLSGHADPGARVAIYAGDQPLGTVTADNGGKWSLAAPRPAASDGFEVRLDQLAADGSVFRRVAAPFEPPPASAAAEAGNYTVRRGNSLWWIARRTYGHGTRFTAIYSANRELIRDPDLIYPGQVLKMPKS
jgi:LysM repeat protein